MRHAPARIPDASRTAEADGLGVWIVGGLVSLLFLAVLLGVSGRALVWMMTG